MTNLIILDSGHAEKVSGKQSPDKTLREWDFNNQMQYKLKKRCEKQGFQYAYGAFLTPVEPPHLVAITTDTDNFMADNRVYFKKTPIKLVFF